MTTRFLCGVLLLLCGPAFGQTTIPLDPRAAYLRCNNDPAPGTVAIPLAPAGIAPSQVVRIRRLGDYDNGPGGDTFGTTIAVFSADATLLPLATAARVPGALEAGCDFVSSPTWSGGLATDIPEDFLVAAGAGSTATQNEVVVVVPANATHLFVCPHDSLYHDNRDPDGDYAVELQVLAPTAWSRLGGGIAGVAGVPLLTGSGELVCGSGVAFDLTRARPLTPVIHVIGLSRIDLPLFGGTLVPQPVISAVLVSTDGSGSARLTVPIPVHFPSAAPLFVQVWLLDPAAAAGIAASDALRAIAP